MTLRGQPFEGFAYFAVALLIAARLLPKNKMNGFTYFLKYYWYLAYLFFVGNITCFIMIFRPWNTKNISFYKAFEPFISWCLGVKYEIRCKQDIPEGGAIVVVNHQHSLDALVILNLRTTLKKLGLVAKRELFFTGLFGLSIWLSGIIPINRKNKKSAEKTLKNVENKLQHEKTKLVIFPEGTRNKHANSTRTLLPFKKGAFHLAITCQAPIIPVVVSPYYFIRSAPDRFFGSGTLICEFLPAISTTGLSESDVETLMEKTRTVMQQKYDQLFLEVDRAMNNKSI